jgi:hypothetical protein
MKSISYLRRQAQAIKKRRKLEEPELLQLEPEPKKPESEPEPEPEPEQVQEQEQEPEPTTIEPVDLPRVIKEMGLVDDLLLDQKPLKAANAVATTLVNFLAFLTKGPINRTHDLI